MRKDGATKTSAGLKSQVRRHGGANGTGGKRRRGAAASEKAIQTRSRREGKEQCRV